MLTQVKCQQEVHSQSYQGCPALATPVLSWGTVTRHFCFLGSKLKIPRTNFPQVVLFFLHSFTFVPV